MSALAEPMLRLFVRPLLCATFAIGAAAVAGCHGAPQTTPTPLPAASPSFVYVTGTPGGGPGHVSVQFDAVVVRSDDTTEVVSNQSMWTSSDPSTLTVSSTGVVTNVTFVGSASIAGTYAGLTDALFVTIGCELRVPGGVFSVPAAGGSISISVVLWLGHGCAWSAMSRNSVLTIATAATGVDAGTLAVSVAPNTGAARIGYVTVAGRLARISQSAEPAAATAVSHR
jgi:hypothetical protein